jgi:hypothetical protein
MRRRAWQLPLSTVVLACGPEAGGDETPVGTTTETDTTSTSTGTADSTSMPASDVDGDTTAPADTGSGSTTGDELVDPCLAGVPPDCGPECTPIVAYAEGDGACGVDGTVNGAASFCASLGEPVGDDYRSTFYATIDDHVWIAFTNHPCIENLPALPIAWTECTGAAGEPEVCTCGCAQDVCGWEAELDVLEACGFATPCGAVNPSNPDDEDLACVLTALRDRTPGMHTVDPESGEYEHRVFVDGDSAQHLRRIFGGICTGPFIATWQPAQTCELQPPAYFDACLQLPPERGSCAQPSDWFVECEETPASCP